LDGREQPAQRHQSRIAIRPECRIHPSFRYLGAGKIGGRERHGETADPFRIPGPARAFLAAVTSAVQFVPCARNFPTFRQPPYSIGSVKEGADLIADYRHEFADVEDVRCRIAALQGPMRLVAAEGGEVALELKKRPDRWPDAAYCG